MSLNFETIINLTEYEHNVEPTYVGSLMIANEPNNAINQFYIYNDRTADKNSTVDYANYTELIWNGPNTSLTSEAVARIGVKSYPLIGAMAFFTLLAEERSKILCPVYVKKTRYTPPTFSFTQSEGQLTFTMQTPEDITYIAWRIIMRDGYQAFEYVSYEDTLTIDEPYLPGTYDTYIVGYTGEGEAVSDDSEHATIVVTDSGTNPFDLFDYYTKTGSDDRYYTKTGSDDRYYTKAEVDALIGQIGQLIDQLNGTVI